MIIGDQNNSFQKKFKNSFIGKCVFTKYTFILFFLFGIILSGYWASNILVTKGYSGLWDFAATLSSNYLNGRKATPENISIEIKDKDLKILEKNRQQALERGVIINDRDGDYVPATLEYKGKKIKIKLRLKGHMTDHLQDNKWSFRIKTKNNDSFMGMKRFSIQHPGTRGYIYEWIYHELMKREDLIALRYKFINVSLNGKDWGIYAVEENFEEELIENNRRKKGPILRFNPDMYWVDRYNEIIGSKPIAEFASYYSANTEAYQEDKTLADSAQHNYYLKAIALIEGIRSRKLSVDQVFDISQLAKFHAIIDLVGGQHSIDWSDIKYYYNPITQKLEPVAYESFTSFPIRELSGTYKYTELDSSKNYEDWHTALFSNSSFFEAYIQQLEKISNSKYLDDFFSESNEELKHNLSILNKEFPYKKFDKQCYYENQEMIKKILDAPKSFHVYFKKGSVTSIQLQIGAIESLPIKIQSVSYGNIILKPTAPIILPAKQNGQYVSYKDYDFPIPSNMIWKDSLASSLIVNYAVLGSSKLRETKIFPFPHTDSEFITTDLKNKEGNIKQFSFLNIDEINKLIIIKPGKQIITENLIIPIGYRLIANRGVSLDLKNKSKIISYSPILFTGSEDENILIESSDSTGQGIEFVETKKSKFNYVTFKNLPKVHDEQWTRSGAITFYESPVEFNYCSFYNSSAEDAINLIRSSFSFKECLFHKINDDALDIDFSDGTISNCVFENCKENAIDITMGKVKIRSMYVNKSGNKAINVKAGSQLSGGDIKIKNSYIAISAEDLSDINLQNITISDSEIGLVSYQNKPDAGYPTLEVSGLILNNVKMNYLKEKKSTIIANGKNILDDVDHVETTIKSEKKNK
jgi:hypothetical protein